MTKPSPHHWTEAWLGRPWKAGEHDCADFVVAVLRAEFGIALDLPAHAASGAGAPSGATARAWDRQIATLKGDYALPTISPRDGDGVLMHARGARRLRRYHLGLWAGIEGEGPCAALPGGHRLDPPSHPRPRPARPRAGGRFIGGGRADMTALKQRSGRADTVTTDLWPHPLTAQGRETRVAAIGPEMTLADLIQDVLGADIPGASAPGASALPLRCLSADAFMEAAIDGRPVARAAWGETRLRPGQIVTLRAAAGDGGGEKNPLRTVLQLALIVATIYVPPLVTSSLLGQAAIGAAIAVGGGLVINAIAPLELPIPEAAAQPEPLYSLTGGANRARPYEPLLLVLGEHRVFPDLAAAEYTEIDGEDQYLHQLFNFGLGDLDVDPLRLGEAALDAYEEVETEWADAAGRIGLVAGNVDTEAGAALDDTAFVARVTGMRTRRIGIDIVGRLFRVTDRGGVEEQAVEIEIEWEAPGHAVERRTVDLRNASQSGLRRTLTYELGAEAQWTVRVRRTTPPSDDDRIYDDLAWAALRSYQPDEADYAGQTRLGVRIRASGQLAGRLNRLSAVVRQKVPVWDGEHWTAPQASSNPAWIFRWYARGVFVGGRLVAGAGLAPERIDDAALIAWGAWCQAQGLRCDHVIDRAVSHAEVLALIARCGRAAVTWQSGRLGVIWDAEGRPATALVTPGNIVAGSFRVEYATGKAAEEVVVRYREPALDWQYNTLRRSVPGLIGAPASSATVTLPGVTGRDQAAMACNLQVARQVYHRRRLMWEMAAEGLALARGDVVHITHSLIDGGAAGRLAGGTADRVTLNRPVDPGADPRLLLRLPDGTLHQTAVTRPPGVQGETADLVLADPLPLAPDADGASPLDTLWRFYDEALPPVRARIIAVQPRGDRHVRFVAIDEVDAYYRLATSDLTAPFPDVVSRTPRVLAVAFAPRRVPVGRGTMTELEATLTVAGDWRGATVRAGPSFAELGTVARLVDGATVARWLVPPETGQAVEIVPGSEAAPAGPRFRTTWMLEPGLAPAPPTDLAVREHQDGTRIYSFTPPEAPDLEGIVLRYAADPAAAWADMTPLHAGFLTASPLEALEPGAGTWTVAARAVSTAGLESESVSVRATFGGQRIGGQRWHVVPGLPPASLGADGDVALRTDTNAVYEKRAGAWVEIADLSGADGARWFVGAGEPPATLGADGDWYFRTSNAGIYRKAGGAWAFQLDIDGTDGATWHGGTGAPQAGLGVVGDWYFRTDNGFVYEKTGAATWTFQRDITGPQGIAGATWLSGSGAPAAGLGADGDFYLDEDDASVWRKAGGAWSEVTSLAGADGATWHTGAAEPPTSLGADGDWYFRTSNAGIYRKAGGAWAFQLDIDGTDGATWHGGTGAPQAGLGEVGDWYFRTDNGFVYEKTGAATWTFQRDITGPQGIAGATWLSGSGAPAAGLGADGDFYLDEDDASVWRKAGGAWSEVASLAGADGATWHTGAGEPPTSLGADGDWYFRTTNAGIYRKAAGAWAFQLDIDGADGATWHGGTGAPPAGLGEVGDWYFRTDNGFVYEKTGAATWTFQRDLTGEQGDPASRGPNVYHYLVTALQQAQLEAAGSALPAALVAIADGETVGENVDGDWIRFWRPGFNAWWNWGAAANAWRRAENWIGAADIDAVNIRAISGDFRDLNVTGTLDVSHLDVDSIRADVRNAAVIYNGNTGPFLNHMTFPHSLNRDDWTHLVLIGGSFERLGQTAAFRIVDIETSIVGWFPQVDFAIQMTETAVTIDPVDTGRVTITGILALRDPDAPPPTPPPPPMLPDVEAPTVTIAAVASVDEDETLALSASVSGGTYDTLEYAWSVVSGGGSFSDDTGSAAVYDPPDVSADTAVTVRCIVTARGSGTNAEDGTSDTASDTEGFTVNVVTAPPPMLPDAAAPAVVIAAVASVDEDETLNLFAGVASGIYDTLEYAWTVVTGGGDFADDNGSTAVYDPPDVSADTAVIVRCTVTARGTGTNAASGTSDTASDTEGFVVNHVAPATTVTADAGADKTVASGGQVTLDGSATVQNGAGATAYAWTRVSGTGGSLDNAGIARPTFTAPTLQPGDADRTIVYELEATNNGVSDTDRVTITVEAPAAGVTFNISHTFPARVLSQNIIGDDGLPAGALPIPAAALSSGVARYVNAVTLVGAGSFLTNNTGWVEIGISGIGDQDFISAVESGLHLTISDGTRSVSITGISSAEPYFFDMPGTTIEDIVANRDSTTMLTVSLQYPAP